MHTFFSISYILINKDCCKVYLTAAPIFILFQKRLIIRRVNKDMRKGILRNIIIQTIFTFYIGEDFHIFLKIFFINMNTSI
ncbi:hypothetical protein CWN72_30095 [Klebsiella pneumoniae]|nr:hypothetical protein CWN72_30095 [Klebsiella pneumoniae]